MSQFKTISSLQNPLVKHLVQLRKDSNYRIAHQSIILEGLKPIQEVKDKVKRLVFKESLATLLSFKAPEMWMVPDSIIEKISGMDQTEGILAEVEMPQYHKLEKHSLLLALDGINDPGNLGTLLRTALALGWEGCYILENSCDPFNEKVIRAARGAHFKFPFEKITNAQFSKVINDNIFQCLFADTSGEPFHLVAPAEKRVLILGNEAHGPTTFTRSLSSPITIPMSGDIESLNVASAGAILLYFLNPQNRNSPQ